MSVARLFDLGGKTALITGGGTGLGQRFAHTLAAAGASVILSARRSGPLEETAQAIRRCGGQARCMVLDIGDAAAVDAAFAEIAGSGCVDVLINNAGAGVGASLLDTSTEQWELVMNANLRGAWLVARAAAAQMIARGMGGSIVNISSILGTSVQKGMGAYATSKAALSQLTRAMALEWARHGIRVNTIAPGYYRTDLSAGYLESATGQAMLKRIPQRRLGEPEELDGALLLLASGASSYMTGTTVTVDGGLSLPVV